MTKVIINGEYAHHRCDFCLTKGRGIAWNTGLGDDSSIAPSDWTKVPSKKGPHSRYDCCPTCAADGKDKSLRRIGEGEKIQAGDIVFNDLGGAEFEIGPKHSSIGEAYEPAGSMPIYRKI